jgi:hypothetical protein
MASLHHPYSTGPTVLCVPAGCNQCFKSIIRSGCCQTVRQFMPALIRLAQVKCQNKVRQGIVRLPREASLTRPKRLAQCEYNTMANPFQAQVLKICLAFCVSRATLPLPAPIGGRERVGCRCVGSRNRLHVRLHRDSTTKHSFEHFPVSS